MCGRFTLTQSSYNTSVRFPLKEPEGGFQRYNIAPGQSIATISRAPDGDSQWGMAQWGFVPSWAKNKRFAHKMINARSETVREKPAYRDAFRSRRCLIPADGFFEWNRSDKQPFYFTFNDRRVFTFGGLWETWQSPEGAVLTSCTLLTTPANKLISDLHPRMPFIVPEESYESWLGNHEQDTYELVELLKPYPSGDMVNFPVSKRVNSTEEEDPACIEPIRLTGSYTQSELFG